MKALVTGHLGFVGRHFTRWLREHGWDVAGIDIAQNGGGDCRDLFKWETQRYDLIVHLAAIVGGRTKIEGDPLSVATDLSIDAEFFNWVVRTHQPRLVYYSSSAAYPVSAQKHGAFPMSEGLIDLDAPEMPDFSYGWAKLTGEQLARYARSYGTKIYVFRPFSGYGSGQALDYPFPSFMQRACRHEDPFIVWGDGEQVRDFIHINDVIEGTMRVVDADCQEPVNLCTGRGVSFNELARMSMLAAGYLGSVENLVDKPVGVQHRVGDSTLMNTFYKPVVELEDGIKEAMS